MTNLGCAVRVDGTLKDASEMEWHYDKDDDTPMVAESSAPGRSFFAPKPAAATVVAGTRRSGRSSRPSTRLLDPDNAMNDHMPHPSTCPQNSTSQKRKAASAAPVRQVVRRRVIELEDEGQAHTDDDADDTEVIDSGTEATAAEFEILQEMADVDHAAICGRNVQDHTADLRTIFKAEKKYQNPDNGKIQNGHWCKVCLDDPNVERSACFLTGSTSTLRMHIARRTSHTKIYIERCRKLGIGAHPRALSKIQAEASDGLLQSTLDSVVSREPKQPLFTTNGLLDYIIMNICTNTCM